MILNNFLTYEFQYDFEVIECSIWFQVDIATRIWI